MVRWGLVLPGIVWVLACGEGSPAYAELAVLEPRCEYSVNPLGLDHPAPRFSWTLGSSQRGQMQSAYQIQVASSEAALAGGGDKWDSGKVSSDRSVNVPYAGSALSSGERCSWRVRCWDAADQAGPWSSQAVFEMGLLQQADWQAQWIRLSGGVTYQPGKFGQALDLDGSSQSVSIAHRAELKPAAQITISAWVLPDQSLGDPWWEIYRKDDSSARHLLALGKTGSTWGVWVGLGIGGSYIEYGAATSRDGLKDGQWHLVTATYDGSAIRVYLDGAEIGVKIQSGALMTSGTSAAYIGSTRGDSEFFAGGIDDVRVYARALAVGEVQALQAGSAVPAPGPVGWWKLDGNLIDEVTGSPAQPTGANSLSPLLRKEFQIDKPVQQARVYMAGVGWSELYVNGAKAGDNVLDPAATDYDKRVLYVTHDVTAMLKPGANALGVMLGNGWFSEPPSPGYGDAPVLRLQLHIRFADGTSSTLLSDGSWRTSSGPITRNDIFGGEAYDARLDKAGWLQAGYDESGWQPAVVASPPGGVMEAQVMPPIKVVQTIRPVSLSNPAAGVYVYDLGQVFGGWSRMKVKGPAGAKVTIKYSARVFADSGLIDKTRHPEPRATDYYTLKGDPAGEVYEPRFTYHPVRYVQLEGYPGTPTVDDLEGRVVHSSVDLSGDFDCSNQLFNQIHKNAVWTLRNELYGFPLDCLYREHWGWLEPGTNPSTLYHHKSMPLFWEKFLKDARYAQHEDGVIPDVVPAYPLKGRTTGDPAWAGNYPLLVWYLYQYYDDRRILEDHYASMKRWMDHLVAISANNLVSTGYYGDHMLPGDSPGNEIFISTETPPPLLWSGFYYRNASILAQAAELLGHTADAQQYGALAQNVKTAINATWFQPEAGRYATGSQTANLFALVLGIVPEANRPGVVGNIAAAIIARDRHFRTGNLGTAALMEASLAEHGQGELMYEVLNQLTYSGYGYMVAQGATTLWEAWGLRDDLGSGEESMDMWGTVEEFFYKDLAGIGSPGYFSPKLMAPGFREIEVKPHVLGDLTHAGATITTVRGNVSSKWRIAEGVFSLEAGVPVNSTARISVPLLGLGDTTLREGGQVVWQNGAYVAGVTGISGASRTGDYVTFSVGSGTYTFARSIPVTNIKKKRRYSQIQPAIDEAEPGDELVVAPGEYHENLILGGKDLIIRALSAGGSAAESAVIRGDGTGPVISFNSAEGQACQLVGLGITGANHLGDGGAILCTGSSPTLLNCVIEGNSARRGGGLCSALGASPRLINCILRGNAAEMGGAVYCSGGDVTLINCTLAGNTAPEGTSLACRSPRLASPSQVSVRNCIFWSQGAEIANLDGSTIDMAYTAVPGGWPGPGNLNSDPLFFRPPDVAGGDWGDLRPRPCSNCVDTGTDLALPADSADLDGDGDRDERLPVDIQGQLRTQGAAVDMGAYETVRAGRLLADMNGDCEVGAEDLVLFGTCATGADIGPPATGCEHADLDADGDVDQDDFGGFQACLGAPGSPADPACFR